MEVEPSIVPAEALSYSEGARRLSPERLTEHWTRTQAFPTPWSLPNPDQVVSLGEGPTEQNQDGGILPHSDLDNDPRWEPLGLPNEEFARLVANARPEGWRDYVPYIAVQLYWSIKRQDFDWWTPEITAWFNEIGERDTVSASTKEHHQGIAEVDEAVVKHWKAAYGYSVWAIDDYQLCGDDHGINVFRNLPIGLYYHWWCKTTVRVAYTRAILIVNRCCPLDPFGSEVSPRITSADFVATIQKVVVNLKLVLRKPFNLGYFFKAIKVGPDEQSNWVTAYICQTWTCLFLRYEHEEIPSIDALREGILISIANEQALALTATRDLGLTQDNECNATVQNVPLPTVHLSEDQLWSGNIAAGETFPQIPTTHTAYYDSPANHAIYDKVLHIDLLDGPTFHSTYTELVATLLGVE